MCYSILILAIKKHRAFLSLCCVFWAIFVLTGVQIYSVFENIPFSSTKSNKNFSPLKSEKALKNQGFLRRYLFYRLFMAERVVRKLNVASPTLDNLKLMVFNPLEIRLNQQNYFLIILNLSSILLYVIIPFSS